MENKTVITLTEEGTKTFLEIKTTADGRMAFYNRTELLPKTQLEIIRNPENSLKEKHVQRIKENL